MDQTTARLFIDAPSFLRKDGTHFIAKKPVASVEEFIALIRELNNRSILLFRGQRFLRDSLLPKVARPAFRCSIDQDMESLEDFKRLSPAFLPPYAGVAPNGVLNIDRSRYNAYVASQIDRQMYARWLAGKQPGKDCDDLINQLVDVVYTVRCNTDHGEKETTDENARTVVNNAYILLRMIVDSFLIR